MVLGSVGSAHERSACHASFRLLAAGIGYSVTGVSASLALPRP